MQKIILQSNDDIVIIDGQEYTALYIKTASNSYECSKARSRRYKKKHKQDLKNQNK